MEGVRATNEQMARVMPHLEFRACRATPMSFLRGQMRVQALQARVREAAEAIAHRSQHPNAVHSA
eukprot:5605892-Prymnesium_polylepis.1